MTGSIGLVTPRLRLRSVLLPVAAVALAGSAGADVIAFDNFDYPDGSLVPNGGWANHSGTPGDLLVSGGQVVVQHDAPQSQARHQIATAPFGSLCPSGGD